MKYVKHSFVLMIVLVQACTNTALERLAKAPLEAVKQVVETGKVLATIQTPRSLELGHRLKFVFILDKSGSNAGDATTPGTDRNGARRYTSLDNFLTIGDESPNVSYSLLTFNTTPKLVSNFTSDRTAFRATVATNANPGGGNPPDPLDAGWTNFLDTIDLARTTIEADLAATAAANPPITSHYVIFFISDGEPVVFGVTQATQSILAKVGQIKDFEVSHPTQVASVQFHTGYYFNPAFQSAGARLLMQQMAQKGEGQAFEFSELQGIDYARFSIPKTNIKYILKDLYVDNVNTVWEGSKLLADSDGDGLSDELEAKLFSNPLKADSDENGISDFVENMIYGKPCNDSAQKCDPAFALRFPPCNGYRIVVPGVPGVSFSDSDNDGLNDCEEQYLLHSKMLDADSNEAWISDLLANKRGYGLLTGAAGMGLDPDVDSMINYFELKRKMPMLARNDSLGGIVPMDYQVKLKESTLSYDTYELVVNNVAVMGNGNSIHIDVFFATSAVDSKRIYRSGTKKLDSQRNVTFTSEDIR